MGASLSGCLLSDPRGIVLIPLSAVEGSLPSGQAAAAAGQRITRPQPCAVAARCGRLASAGAHCSGSLTRKRTAMHELPAVGPGVHCVVAALQASTVHGPGNLLHGYFAACAHEAEGHCPLVRANAFSLLSRQAPGHLSCACRPCMSLPCCPPSCACPSVLLQLHAFALFRCLSAQAPSCPRLLSLRLTHTRQCHAHARSAYDMLRLERHRIELTNDVVERAPGCEQELERAHSRSVRTPRTPLTALRRPEQHTKRQPVAAASAFSEMGTCAYALQRSHPGSRSHVSIDYAHPAELHSVALACSCFHVLTIGYMHADGRAGGLDVKLRACRASSNSSSCSWLCRPSLALNMGYLL